GIAVFFAQAEEGREFRWRAAQIAAVATGAVRLVQALAAHLRRLRLGSFNQPQNPGHLVRVDVKPPCFGIESRAAPFAAPVKAREDHSAFQAGWLELAVAVNLLESFERGLVGFGRAPSQHFFGQNLARERRRRQWERLTRRTPE